MGLDFSVSAAVLVPRPETELLIETVEKEEDRQAPLRILDMGTGSGAIIISLLHHFTTATGRGVDISAEALAVAKKNGEALCVDRVEWTKSDLFADVPAEQYDWLVSNPPYLTQEDMGRLEPEVSHDPEQALFGGADGLDVYRRIAADGAAYVKAGGKCTLEVGAGQARAVADIFTATDRFRLIRICKDYGGIERLVLLEKKR